MLWGDHPGCSRVTDSAEQRVLPYRHVISLRHFATLRPPFPDAVTHLQTSARFKSYILFMSIVNICKYEREKAARQRPCGQCCVVGATSACRRHAFIRLKSCLTGLQGSKNVWLSSVSSWKRRHANTGQKNAFNAHVSNLKSNCGMVWSTMWPCSSMRWRRRWRMLCSATGN